MKAKPRIADFMATELVTLTPETEINRAMKTLLDERVSGAPVLDAKGQLVGLLSKKDCLRAVLSSSYYQEWGGTVADYMSSPVETLEADLELVQAAEKFLASHFRLFPVMRDGRLAGQISRTDVLRGLTENWL
ncbi:MAG: CBS domain-containing protein [Rhizobiaceae bacterium]|nr:CBS domain-containing protein [Rhizobiaceae bacterium]